MTCEGNKNEEAESIAEDDHEVIGSRRKKMKKRARSKAKADDNSFDEDLAPLYEMEDEDQDERDVIAQLDVSPLHVDYVVLPKPKGQRNFKAVSPLSHVMASQDVLNRLVMNNGIRSASISFLITLYYYEISDHLGQEVVRIIPNTTPEEAAAIDMKLQEKLEAFKKKSKAGTKRAFQETRR